MAKGYGAKRFLKEFPLKNWSLAGLKRLIKNIDDYAEEDRAAVDVELHARMITLLSFKNS